MREGRRKEEEWETCPGVQPRWLKLTIAMGNWLFSTGLKLFEVTLARTFLNTRLLETGKLSSKGYANLAHEPGMVAHIGILSTL